MDRRSLLKTGSALGLFGAAGILTPVIEASGAEARHWRMANLYPRGISFGVAYQGFADAVNAMSGGRLTIEVVYDGEGVAATEVLSAARSGLVEMGAPYMALHAGDLPAGVVELGLPGGPTELNHLLALFYEGGWIEAIREAYASIGLYYTAPVFQPGVYLMTKKEITSLSDLQGLTLRSPGAYGKFMANFGVKPVVMSFSELYTSLATGVVDGAASSNLIDYRDGSFVEVAKWMYPVALTGAQVAGVIVNMEQWDALPDDLKAIVNTAAIHHGLLHANKSTVWVSEAVKQMEAKGLKWSPAPSDADLAKWKSAGADLWSVYAKSDPFSKKLIDLMTAFSDRIGI